MYFDLFLAALALAFGWVKWEEIPSAKVVTNVDDFKRWESE